MLRLLTFGGLALECDEQPLGGVANRKVPLALLALLGAHAEHGISRDKLIAYLWPESDEARGRNSLKQALFALRRELGDAFLAPGTGPLRLDSRFIHSDVVAFEDALRAGDQAAAVELYRGPFLDGFFVEDRGEFERWAEVERQRLHGLCLDALTNLAEGAEAARDRPAAARWWRRCAAADPHSPHAALGVMRALVAVGDRAGAIEHARLYEAGLQDDLGLPPDESIREYARGIRQQDPVAQGPTRYSGAVMPPQLVAAMVTSGGVAFPLDEPDADERRIPASAWAAYMVPLFLALAVAGAALSWNARSAPTDSEAPSRLTVLPFETLGGPASGELGAGLDALVSSGLDGLPEIRSVPVAKTRDGTPPSAVAHQSGARLYVTGRLIADRDSLRAFATLRDRANAGGEIGRAEAQAARGELFELADRLVRGLVADRARGPGERLARTAAMTTRSLPALKAFLDGDRRLRAENYRAAIDAYGLAVRIDSAFGLAYYRLSVAADRAGEDEQAVRAARLAARFSERLPERDRRLVTAYLMARTGLLDESERLYRGIVTDYPEDAETWLQLGELLLHGNPLRGRSATEAREAFARVLTLDPQQGDALVHLARVAALEGGTAEVDSLVRRARAGASSPVALDLRAIRTFALTDRPGRARTVRDLLGRPSIVPRHLPLKVAVRLDDLEGTERFATVLARATGTCDVRALGGRMLAEVAFARGQEGDAGRRLDDTARCEPAAVAELRAVMSVQPFLGPAEADLRDLRHSLELVDGLDLDPSLRAYYSALVDLRLGDTAAAAGAARDLQLIPDSTATGDLARTLAHSLIARLRVAEHRPAAALAELEGAGWERMAGKSMAEVSDRFLRAELLNTAGRVDEAIGWYAAIAQRASYELVYLAPAELRLARIYDERGEARVALKHYERFVELWRGADRELQPAVADAERRIEELRPGAT